MKLRLRLGRAARAPVGARGLVCGYHMEFWPRAPGVSVKAHGRPYGVSVCGIREKVLFSGILLDLRAIIARYN